ncbi:MAG: hypothetical protein Q4G67_12460 [Actinomycetia bacterium]|nr:hypothetical protein [Actinomycetes bacterium]
MLTAVLLIAAIVLFALHVWIGPTFGILAGVPIMAVFLVSTWLRGELPVSPSLDFSNEIDVLRGLQVFIVLLGVLTFFLRRITADLYAEKAERDGGGGG